MGYSGLMGYGMQIPAHQLGGPIVLWVIRGYGLSQVWVKRSSTVLIFLAGMRTNSQGFYSYEKVKNYVTIYSQFCASFVSSGRGYS